MAQSGGDLSRRFIVMTKLYPSSCGPVCRPPNQPTSRAASLLVVFVLATTAAVAEPMLCDASLTVLAGHPHGYRLRGDRCEGVYVEEVSGTSLKIVSFTEWFEDFNPAAETLMLAWTAPQPSIVHLRADAVKRRIYYRMDTVKAAERTSYEWPTSLLAALQLRQADLGALAWADIRIGTSTQAVHLPLRIGKRSEADAPGQYRLLLMPGRRLSEVYVHLAPVRTDGTLGRFVVQGEPLRYGQYPAERAIPIRVTVPPVSGLYYLELGADIVGGTVATTQLYFFHPPH